VDNNRLSRYEKQDKRRKANVVLNILIAIVAVLIVVVASQLFTNPPQNNEQATSNQEEETNAPASDEKNQSGEVDKKENTNDNADDQKQQDDEGVDDQSTSDDPFEGAEITEGGSSSDVEQTIVNPDWKPVGTEQSGEHTATYDSSSKDWKEMLKAISSATGVPEDQMTVLWLGNNGGPQDAKGTIMDKESGEKYRVEITWEDRNGWKPTKVEKLKS
jgi:cytoskeletal protein RodZ